MVHEASEAEEGEGVEIPVATLLLEGSKLVQGDRFRAISVVLARNGDASDWKTVVRINNNGGI